MSALRITLALKGQWRGTYGTARCPAHDDRNPSLSISDGDQGLLLKCHAGCSYTDILHALTVKGLREEKPIARTAAPPKPDRRRMALDIWRECQSAANTTVERYLRGRGITVDIPSTIRQHPGLRHCAGNKWPAMVAAVCKWPGMDIAGVHRTFLDETGSKAPISRPKMMLGPSAGGAVRLAPHGGTLIVTEGIETGLSVMQSTGLPTWAALSTSGLTALVLPDEVREVLIAADRDDAGEMAALKAAARWVKEKRRVRIARPPHDDFNDLLRKVDKEAAA
jgi:putative DNA primase/helicase